MKYFLMSCWTESGEVIAAIVKIDARLARKIRDFSLILSSKMSQEAGLDEIAVSDTSVVYFPEDMTPSDYADWGDSGWVFVEISKANFDAIRKEIGNSAPRTVGNALHVSAKTFHWTGITKYGSEEIDGVNIPVSALQ